MNVAKVNDSKKIPQLREILEKLTSRYDWESPNPIWDFVAKVYFPQLGAPRGIDSEFFILAK